VVTLGLGALYYFRSCRNQPIKDAVVAVDSTANAVGDSASAILSGISKKLSTGIELNFGKESIENELIGFIDDAGKAVDKTTWFNFRGLKFDTGKSDLKAETTKEIDNLYEILKAYPNVSLKIGGYTDNVGKEASNMKLSADRAMSVLKALVAKGIDATRLEAEGYGSQFPAASNDTEEGRAQNRRIAVRVTKK
jgi:OmpA-OmpF porin, OOP family